MIEEWISQNVNTFITIVIIIGLWDGVWKLIAMWKAAQRKSKWWFIVLSVINSIGILPITYLLITKRK